MSQKSPSTVFLTGAGGFVGGRVAHRIALGEEQYDLKALLHNPSGPGAMRLARLPAEIEVGSVLDGDRMTELLADCDAVINCAFGMGKTSEDGTRNLLQAAEAAGIESFVHMSTAVVHGHELEGTLDETAPLKPDTEYGEWKLKAEEIISEFAATNSLDPTIVRPFIVYGPYSEWVTRIVDQLRTGAVLTEGGFGALNQIYIDNLVDILLLALDNPAARGEAFLAADDEEVRWREYYHDISAMIGEHPPIKTMSQREIAARKKGRLLKDSVLPPARIPMQIATSTETRGTVASELSQTPWAEPVLKQLPAQVREGVLDTLSNNGHNVPFERLHSDDESSEEEPETERYQLPSKRYIDMHTSTGRISTDKLKEVLGWEPRVSYDESIDLITDWLKYEQIV